MQRICRTAKAERHARLQFSRPGSVWDRPDRKSKTITAVTKAEHNNGPFVVRWEALLDLRITAPRTTHTERYHGARATLSLFRGARPAVRRSSSSCPAFCQPDPGLHRFKFPVPLCADHSESDCARSLLHYTTVAVAGVLHGLPRTPTVQQLPFPARGKTVPTLPCGPASSISA